ncbi:MAG: glycosyltransferase family 4 protein [Bdellovibrionales bacterium]|nr:glycosyltransferase family 4 protein [Bdellovibrionales bacterium]
MRVFFVADYCIPIHARTLDERPLGGTETGLIRLAEQLHLRGHEVSVFTSMPSPPPSPPESPQYLPFTALPLAGECDLFIAIQSSRSVFHEVKAQKVVYWTGDGPEQFTTFGIGDLRFQRRVHQVLCVSDSHKESLCKNSGYPPERVSVIRNGIAYEDFEGSEIRERQRLIFTSAPHRGLQQALATFRILKEKFPALELHVFSGFELYDREQPFQGPQTKVFHALRQECEQLDGCFLHGNVKQSELAREYLRSGVYIYPALVPETSCITAIEAKAAGCPAVVSSLGALPETVGKDGFVVGGDPMSNEFLHQFVERVGALLVQNELWAELSQGAVANAKANYTWAKVADRFEAIAKKLLL